MLNDPETNSVGVVRVRREKDTERLLVEIPLDSLILFSTIIAAFLSGKGSVGRIVRSRRKPTRK